jgi:hypothetical protein
MKRRRKSWGRRWVRRKIMLPVEGKAGEKGRRRQFMKMDESPKKNRNIVNYAKQLTINGPKENNFFLEFDTNDPPKRSVSQ